VELGPVSASNTDGALSSYEWDVTSLITGSGNYTASYYGADYTYGLALSVVFSDTSLPEALLVLNKGALEINRGDIDQTIHTTVAGSSELWIYTQADNLGGETGETIDLNGETVGGPINNNLGTFASLFHLDSFSSIDGNNIVSINSPHDFMGWNLSMLKTTLSEPTIPVPEPSMLGMLFVGGIALYSAVKKRK
jgi:hypothetical protein